MANKVSELQQEIETLEAEANHLQSSIQSDLEEHQALNQQYSGFRVVVAFPQSNKPEDLAEFHQKNAREAAQWKGFLHKIGQEMRLVEKKIKSKREHLQQKQGKLNYLKSQSRLYQLQQSVASGPTRLQVQGEKINQLALKLETELRNFYTMYHELNDNYTELGQKSPDVAEFGSLSVPHVVRQDHRFTVTDRLINWHGHRT